APLPSQCPGATTCTPAVSALCLQSRSYSTVALAPSPTSTRWPARTGCPSRALVNSPPELTMTLPRIRSVPARSWAVVGKATTRNKPIEAMGEAVARMARSYPFWGLTADGLVRGFVVAVVGRFIGCGHGSGGTGDHAGSRRSAGAAGGTHGTRGSAGTGGGRDAADGVHAGGEG